MDRQQLETWLCEGATDPSPREIAALIAIPYDEIGDSTLLRVADRLLGLRFTIAALRDVFTDDRGVDLWLRAPRPELGGLSALDLLLAGDLPPVEALAVREWNDAASAPADEVPPAAAHGYRQSVGRSSATRAETAETAGESDDWPADPTFSTVWAV
jgi:antitoxin Xre/MbcA/ParS-like protein